VGRGDVGNDGGELATRTGATTATRGHHADGGYTTRLTKIPAFAVPKAPPTRAVTARVRITMFFIVLFICISRVWVGRIRAAMSPLLPA
jgi:hypothetical protein